MKIFILLLFLVFASTSSAQLVITDEPSATALAQQLVGAGISISNVSFTGNSLMAGRFKNQGGLTDINIDSGIVLTSGAAKTDPATFVTGCDGDGVWQAQSVLSSTGRFLPGDPALANAIGANVLDMYDACVLEFDFIPSGDSVKFKYVFSSEEYTAAYVCEYNDAFAFFISGPGIVGQRNIALVPGTNIPVSIFNVNEVLFGTCPSYTTYFNNNITNQFFTHDGHTVALTAMSRVQPCSTYHLKIVIADYLDGILDSGVFLEGKSLTSNEPPALEAVSASSSCGGGQVSLNFSEDILCNSIQNTDFVITGPGGPYTVTGWSSSSCSAGNIGTPDITLTVNPSIADNGLFQVCLTDVTNSVTDLCGNIASPACLDFNIATTIPVFNTPAPICSGSTAPILPTTSINGVNGTWSPATVSNTVSGTYTFTPSTGQCAAPVSVSITVTTGIVPAFNPVAPICTGSVAPLLPTTSTNGITGTWSPSVVSNTASGVYTFTPAAGQCAVSATLPVTINSILTSNTNVTICSTQLPYSWNGNNYPTEGNYSITLTSSSGCDSVATLILTTNPVTTSTASVAICDNHLPYNWNGNNYPTAGNYSVTLTSSSGCDSVATLILTTNPVVSSTTFETICENQFPYNWNGNNYTAAGTYTITLMNSNGCDSVATLILAANAVVSSTTFETICENLFPYNWNGNAYPSPGTYSVSLINNNGCDSVATLILGANAVVSSTTFETICENLLPYNWNGNSYPTAGSYSVMLVNSNGCDSLATLELTVNNNSTSTTPITICENLLPYNWNGNSYPTAGIYSVTLTNSNGCDSLATLELTVNNNSTSTTPATICENLLPYNWNGNSYPTAGIYSVTLTNSNGCDSLATLELTVTNNSTSTTPVTICENLLPYSWNGNLYPTAGNYSVMLVSGNGCDSTANLELTVNNNSTSTTPITICENMLPYNWNGNNYPTAGIYPVTLINSNGCDSIATLELTVNNNSTSTTPITICENLLPYNWNGNNYPTGGNYSVTLANSNGCDSVARLELTVNNNSTSTTPITICENLLPYNWNGNNYPAAGNYSVTLSNSNGCDSVATLELTVNNNSTSTTSVSICENQLPYSWNGNTYPAAGAYSVILVNSNGCDSVATLELTVNINSTSTTSVTICENLLPFSWNGNNYSTAGTYSETLINSSGCDSVTVLILTTNSITTSTTAVAICESALPYNWNGNNYPLAGTYSVTLTNSNGCDSLVTLALTANTITTSTTSATICENQLPYNWNGNSYQAVGTYLVTLTNSNGCDSVATLILTTSNVVYSTTAVSICGDQLPYNWNGNSYPSAGTYSVNLTGNTGCDSIATLVLTVNIITSGTTTATICSNQLPYAWNGDSYLTNGTYSATLTNSHGCDSIATLILTINNVTTSSIPVTICENQVPYTWNGNNYLTTGAYSVTLANSLGCDSTATLNLTVNNVASSITAITICSNQLPYSWNGNSYPGGGTYSITLTNSSGCDSVATLILTTNDVLSGTSFVTICESQMPYNWNGSSYPVAGTYSITLTGSSGCDSVATLILSTNTTVTSTTAVTICSNQLPYSWNSNSYTAPGTYSTTLTGNSGCDSVATLILTVNNTSSGTETITLCANQLPYSWNGNMYQNEGTYSLTLTGSSGCDSVATLNLVVNVITTSTTLVTICQNLLPYNWNGNSYSSGGNYSVTLTNNNNCDSIATLVLTANTILTSNTDLTICSNQSPYNWNGQSYITGGIYQSTLTSSAGCDSIATLNLTINPVQYSTTNASICSIELPYLWNGQSYNATGAHVVTLTSVSGCDSIATLNLTVNVTPATPAVISPVIYCQHDVTNALSATITTAGSHLAWYTSPAGGTASLATPVPSSAFAGTTHYYVSQVNGPCEGPRVLITVTVNSKPDLGPDKSLKICHGQSANLATLFNTSGYTVNWIYNNEPAADPGSVTEAGSYMLIVQNGSGCGDTSLVNLVINPPVTANAGPDSTVETNTAYQLSGSGGLLYQWSPSQTLNSPFIFNPVAVLSHDETFILLVSDDIGCFDLDTVNLRVLNGPTFYVPSAFTPNGDGLNDFFRPTAVGIKSLDFFRVFNRYGELVYETHDLKKGWDGIYKGKKQPVDNYVWSLKGTDRFDKVKTMKGNVVLIR